VHESWHTDGNVGYPIQWAKSGTIQGGGADPATIKRYGGYKQGATDQWNNVAEPDLEKQIAAAQKQPKGNWCGLAATVINTDMVSKTANAAILAAGSFHTSADPQIYITGLPPVTLKG
jgi:hypothetical protein